MLRSLTQRAAAQSLMRMTGLEAVQSLIDAQHSAPAIGAALGFTLADVEDGKAIFVGEPSERALNPLGIVHGGWALTLIDSCAGCAAHTTLPAGVGYTSVEPKVNFVRARDGPSSR